MSKFYFLSIEEYQNLCQEYQKLNNLLKFKNPDNIFEVKEINYISFRMKEIDSLIEANNKSVEKYLKEDLKKQFKKIGFV